MKFVLFTVPANWGRDDKTGKIIKLPAVCCGTPTIIRVTDNRHSLSSYCKDHLSLIDQVVSYPQPCEYCQDL